MVHQFHKPIDSVPIVHLSYHRGVHYNSVRRIDDPKTRGVPPVKKYPISHDLEVTKIIVFSKNLTPEELKNIK